MHLLIKIPHEYEDEFLRNRFFDTISRFIADANCLAGKYEIETATMLEDAFRKATLMPDNIIVHIGIPNDIMPKG